VVIDDASVTDGDASVTDGAGVGRGLAVVEGEAVTVERSVLVDGAGEGVSAFAVAGNRTRTRAAANRAVDQRVVTSRRMTMGASTSASR
jgi:hypothetical protein